MFEENSYVEFFFQLKEFFAILIFVFDRFPDISEKEILIDVKITVVHINVAVIAAFRMKTSFGAYLSSPESLSRV